MWDQAEEMTMTAAPTDSGYALDPGDGQATWFLGTLMTAKAGSEQTGGAFTLLEWTAPPGFAPPLHLHQAEDEAFYILDGAMTVTCGDRSWQATPGSFVFLPRGVAHGFTVTGTSPLRGLQLTVPGGFERFMAEVGEPAQSLTLPPSAAPDVEKLLASAARHRIDILGPPPSQ
jgi:mannose-6-phosphate isomerase-like protein (cupin superfamily)